MPCLCQYLASIVQYVERNLLLLATSASDLLLCINKFCSVLLFVMVVHAGCDKQNSWLRGSLCSKLHDQPLQPAVIDPTARYSSRITIFGCPTSMFGTKKLEWCDFLMVKKFEDTCTRFNRIHKRDRWTDRHYTLA